MSERKIEELAEQIRCSVEELKAFSNGVIVIAVGAGPYLAFKVVVKTASDSRENIANLLELRDEIAKMMKRGRGLEVKNESDEREFN